MAHNTTNMPHRRVDNWPAMLPDSGTDHTNPVVSKKENHVDELSRARVDSPYSRFL